MSTTLIVFPHQLFIEHPGLLQNPTKVILIEDPLFFGSKRYVADFHKQKLWFHRATMMHFAEHLKSSGVSVDYIEHHQRPLKSLVSALIEQGCSKLIVAELHDDLLERRLRSSCARVELELEVLSTPMFLNSQAQNTIYRQGKKRWFMADFYKHQRRRLDILMEDGSPAGGQWSFDHQNRKKVPKRMLSSIPPIAFPELGQVERDARAHVLEKYPNNPGCIDALIYPTNHASAADWLSKFLIERFELFGDYEDAIVKGENFLWHSVLTPMLNVGLLTPQQVVNAVLEYSSGNTIPLNALEGFLRQVIGWREFMRATYQELGVQMRTTNHWQHHRKIPQSFYNATTGIDPIDDAIRRVLDTGYCHHIERLMILGGFMFLCEFDPDDIYRWFMEMFVDSYDWVMVPNVYAMSQHADGGLITTKPYFSGSSYVRKMSNHGKGEWATIWDGLYWRWITIHSDELSKNPRWAMMCAMARKMDPSKRAAHLAVADAYLESLS